MDLPSAYRRPKFRLEEVEKKDAAKITVGFVLFFLVLIVVWAVIKVPMFNPEQVMNLGYCTDPVNATENDQPKPPVNDKMNFAASQEKCVRADGVFKMEDDALPILYTMRFGAKASAVESVFVEFYEFMVRNVKVAGVDADTVESSLTCEKNACKMQHDLVYIVNRDVAEVTDVTFMLDATAVNSYADVVIEYFSIVATSTNPDFEFNELIIRYFFLILATGVAARFYYAIAFGRLKYPWQAWALEQKWTFILLILLIGFNNPFCWAKRYSDPQTKGFWLFIDVALRYTFLLGYLLAVLAMIDHISQTKRKTTRAFYIPKLALLAPLWLVLVVRSLQTMNTQEQALHKPLVVGFVSVIMSVYLLWLIYLIAVMINKVSHAPPGQTVHVGVRFKLTWCLNLVMIIAIAAALYRVNAWGVESTEFIFGYAGFNFYVFILSALFAPAATSMPYRAPTRPAPEAEVVINDEYEVEGDY